MVHPNQFTCNLDYRLEKTVPLYYDNMIGLLGKYKGDKRDKKRRGVRVKTEPGLAPVTLSCSLPHPGWTSLTQINIYTAILLFLKGMAGYIFYNRCTDVYILGRIMNGNTINSVAFLKKL